MEKNKDKILLFGILLIVLVLAFYVISASLPKNKNQNNQNNINFKNSNFQPLTSSKNNVEFQVTPLSPSEFQIAINTHSVELDFDPAEISTLHDDLGNIYKPTAWDGSAAGGHHRNGVLKFPEINKNAKSIKLVIKDSATREFEWKIK